MARSHKIGKARKPRLTFWQTLNQAREISLGAFGNKRFVLSLVFLAFIIGGVGLANGPLFHSYQSLSGLNCLQKITGPSVLNKTAAYDNICPHDPILPLWSAGNTTFKPATASGVTGPYSTATDDGCSNVNSPQDSPPQNPIFFAKTRWWVFYPGCAAGQATLNYTTATALSGSWVEHSTGPYTFHPIDESTELAYAHNSTHVFILVTPRDGSVYFKQMGLNTDGTVTLVGGWQIIATGVTQSQDAAMVFQEKTPTNDRTMFLFYACANGCFDKNGNAVNSAFICKVSTSSAFTAWSFCGTSGGGGSANNGVLRSNHPCGNDYQGAGAVDLGDGDIEVMVGQFGDLSNPNCSNGLGFPLVGFQAFLLNNTKINANETVPMPANFASIIGNGYGLFTYLFNVGLGKVTAAIDYDPGDLTGALYQNRFLPFFSTRTSNGAGQPGTWSVPVLTYGDWNSPIAGVPASSLDSNANYLQCVTYNNVTKNYFVEQQYVGGGGPTANRLTVIMTDSTFTPIASVNPVSLGTYQYNGSGVCEASVSVPTSIPFGFVVGALPGTLKFLAINQFTMANNQDTIGGWNCNSKPVDIYQHCKVNKVPSCGQGQCLTLDVSPTLTYPGVAISKNPMDLSTSVSKVLQMWMRYHLNATGGCCGQTSPQVEGFAFYLTRNNTAPIGSTTFDPYTDVNTVLLFNMVYQGNAGKTWEASVFLQREPLISLAQGDPTGCGTSGTPFTCTQSFTLASQLVGAEALLSLNYTASNLGTSLSCMTWAWTSSSSPGSCDTAQNSSLQNATSTTLPWLNLGASKYYLGLYVPKTFGVPVDYYLSFSPPQDPITGQGNSMLADQYTPGAPSLQPTVDTGGFFGPVIKALVTVGLAMAAYIIGFAVYVYNLLAPVGTAIFNLAAGGLAGIISIFYNVVKGILNSVGGILGLGALGDNLFALSTQLGAAFTTFFGLVISQFGNIFGTGVSIMQALGSVLTNFWSGLTQWLIPLADYLSLFWSTAALFGQISFSLLFSFWMLYGALRFSRSMAGGMEWYNTTGYFMMLGFSITLFFASLIINYVIIPVAHIMTSGSTTLGARPKIEVAGTSTP